MGVAVRVLLTGALGYIGSPVVRALHAAGHHVTGLDTGWFVHQFAEPPAWPDRLVMADIRTRQGAERFDAVVHLAGLSNDPMGALDPTLTEDINFYGTVRLMAQYPRARHVVVSSASVYGAVEMADETTPTAPLSVYARCKAAVDVEAARYDAVSLRLGTVYGYAPGHRTDLVLNAMCAAPSHITARGNARRPIVHVDDVASVIACMLGRTERGVYNVVGHNVTVGELAERVQAATGARILYEQADDPRDYWCAGDRLAALWSPSHTDLDADIRALAGRDLPPREYRRLPALLELGVLTKEAA